MVTSLLKLTLQSKRQVSLIKREGNSPLFLCVIKTKTDPSGYPFVIRLRPIQTEQTFSIIPSSFEATDLDAASITLTENGTSKSESNVLFTWLLSDNERYIEISMTPTIVLKEDQIYTLELKTSTDVLYRDLIYITSKTNKNEVFAYPERYTQRDNGDEYIVL